MKPQSTPAPAPSDAEIEAWQLDARFVSDKSRSRLNPHGVVYILSGEQIDKAVELMRRPAAPSPAFPELLRAAQAVIDHHYRQRTEPECSVPNGCIDDLVDAVQRITKP